MRWSSDTIAITKAHLFELKCGYPCTGSHWRQRPGHLTHFDTSCKYSVLPRKIDVPSLF